MLVLLIDSLAMCYLWLFVIFFFLSSSMYLKVSLQNNPRVDLFLATYLALCLHCLLRYGAAYQYLEVNGDQELAPGSLLST